MNNVLLGWYILCNCDHFYEPEGTVFLDKEPKKGDKLALSDGKLWTVTRVNKEELTLYVG